MAVADALVAFDFVDAMVLALASLAGLMMLGWPLLLDVPESARVDPPFIFLALLPVGVLARIRPLPSWTW